jgi:hypothetical protein
MKIETPKNRNAEMLAYFMENSKKEITYYEIANIFQQLNAHKRRGDLEKHGISFKKRTKIFTNRYGRTSNYCTFQLNTPLKIAKDIYKLVNKSKKK